MSNHVYIVDDDPAVLGSTEMLLKAVYGLQPRAFDSADAMLAAADSLAPGCILTDLHMPGMNGLELQAELGRRSIRWPVVFMTGRGDIPTVVRALKGGAIEFIEKPFCETRLRAALNAAFAALDGQADTGSTRIRDALHSDAVHPHYQPKFDLRTGALVGLEALMRWTPDVPQRDRGKAIHEAFEDKALGRALSRRIREGVMANLAGWAAEGIDVGHVSINASACDIEDPAFADELIGALDTLRIPRRALQVEITETVTLDLQQRGMAESTLGKLNAAGIGIALDDFGTGFASLTHLKTLPVDVLKIDRSFVSSLPEASSVSIVKAIVGLAKGLGKQVVAEGVETRAQAEFLRVSGCDHGQGYLFGRPIPAAEVAALAGDGGGWTGDFGWSRRVRLAG